MFSRTTLGNVSECRTECKISDSTGAAIVVYESSNGWHVINFGHSKTWNLPNSMLVLKQRSRAFHTGLTEWRSIEVPPFAVTIAMLVLSDVRFQPGRHICGREYDTIGNDGHDQNIGHAADRVVPINGKDEHLTAVTNS
jgi:hypothetical protein